MPRWMPALLLLALCACNLVSTEQAARTGNGGAPAQDTGSSGTTYTHPTIRYTFDYPLEWYVDTSDPNFVQVWSMQPDAMPADSLDSIQGDFVVMSLVASDQPTGDSLNAVVERYKAVLTGGGTEITSETPISLPGGLEAVELRTADGGLLVLTLVNGYALQIDGVGSPQFFYAVVDTLRAG